MSDISLWQSVMSTVSTIAATGSAIFAFMTIRLAVNERKEQEKNGRPYLSMTSATEEQNRSFIVIALRNIGLRQARSCELKVAFYRATDLSESLAHPPSNFATALLPDMPHHLRVSCPDDMSQHYAYMVIGTRYEDPIDGRVYSERHYFQNSQRNDVLSLGYCSIHEVEKLRGAIAPAFSRYPE
ncbi:hypothetical protein [Kordiimonas marina]|uniref:hypothetical protein n=1 Tax=Kordiimonas marina TaxID=2872312 RepID=UPI001FF16749|nr:hypothetical protein [Kordiimonas marina]MCJ9427633.1 hypothetical protein [Kordiimonas marina]